MRKRPRLGWPRGWPSCSPPWHGGLGPLGKPRGRSADWRFGISVHALRRARPLGEGNAAPLGAPHGVGRPAGARFRLTARFQHLRWAWPSPGSERIAWGRCAPGRIPEPPGPRACKARRRRRRTPLRRQMPLEAPSSERGCHEPMLGGLVAATANSAVTCEHWGRVRPQFIQNLQTDWGARRVDLAFGGMWTACDSHDQQSRQKPLDHLRRKRCAHIRSNPRLELAMAFRTAPQMTNGSFFGCIVGKFRRTDPVTASSTFHAAECCGHDDPPCY
jgi:hypothetical protein